MSDSTAEALPEALIILVQQECCLRKQGVVCRLLATSKSLHSFILANCIGRVHIVLARALGFHRRSAQLRKSCRAWLAKYGCLMHTLVWEPVFSDWVDDGKQMAELLEAAAATPQGLHLRSFDATAFDTEKLPLVLHQLPAATLTHLAFEVRGMEPTYSDYDYDMPIYSDDDEWAIQEAFEQEMMEQRLAVTNHDTETTAAVLKSLTQLRSLKLTSGGMPIDHKTSPLLQVLPQLTSLTKLTMKFLLHTGIANAMTVHDCLPPHLHELELLGISSRQWSWPQPATLVALALGHLTALTRLHTDSRSFDVAADDVLPPNLHTLCVNKVASVKPLLPLTRLRQLTVASLPDVAEIAAAIAAAGRAPSDDKDSERAAAPAPAGEAAPGAPAGGSFEERVAQLQLLLPGVAIMQ